MRALVAGQPEASAALGAALAEHEIEAEVHSTGRSGARSVAGLAGALVELERRLEADRPRVAVAVGTGDAALALAVSAAKLGVPVAAWIPDGGAGDPDAAEARILRVLADLDVGGPGDGVAAADAAERIASWPDLN